MNTLPRIKSQAEIDAEEDRKAQWDNLYIHAIMAFVVIVGLVSIAAGAGWA